MASRSVADATRFTANSPHAYTQHGPPRSSTSTSSTPQQLDPRSPTSNRTPPGPNSSRPPPPAETAQEKVARLRAARLAQRNQQLTTWERTVVRGRVWADRLHRITALSLIGFSIIAFGVTTFALTDMVLHNRRKRSAFFDQQHTIYNTRLIAAIETEKAGVPLADDQLVILGREKNKVQEEERRKALGWWGRTKGALFSGLAMDMGGKDERIPVPTEAEVLQRIGVSSVGVLEASEGKASLNRQGELEGVKPLTASEESQNTRNGPQLNSSAELNRVGAVPHGTTTAMHVEKLAEQTAQDVKAQATGWKDWLGWGGSKGDNP